MDDGTRLLLIAVAVPLGWWVMASVVFHYTRCWRSWLPWRWWHCRGGKVYSANGKNWHDCHGCGGSGKRRRFLAMWLTNVPPGRR